MASEKWLPVDKTDNVYFVSSYGRIKNILTGKILKPRPTQNGYLRVHLRIGGVRKDYYIHRLVADVFCFRPEGCDVVNHIDYDNSNNHAENLEWSTQKSNILHSMDNGRYKRKTSIVIGEKDGHKYLFHSSRDAANATGCDHKTILRSCKLGKRTTNGFLWKKVS